MKMKRMLSMMLIAASLAVTVSSCKNGVKDEDLKATVEKALKADSMMMNPMVDVKEGVVTVSGQCKDDKCKDMCQKMITDIKGVKSVVNNCTVTPPVTNTPASVTTELDAATQQKVKDGIKDIKGISVEFTGGKAVFSGEITKSDRMKLMQMLASAKVLNDVTKLADKK